MLEILNGKIVGFVEGIKEEGFVQRPTEEGQNEINVLIAQEPDACFWQLPGRNEDGVRGFKIVKIES